METLVAEKEKCVLVGEINQDLQSMDARTLRRIKDITRGMCIVKELQREPDQDKKVKAS